jgi:hypothetical protein
MAEEHDFEKLEQQRDWFTFCAGIFFVCLIISMAHGFFDMGARGGSFSMKVFRFVSLFVLPGLLSGFVWHKWGILIGAGSGAAVRILSLFNLGFNIPFFAQGGEYVGFSFDRAVEDVAPFSLALLAAAAAGAVAAGAGYMLSVTPCSAQRWFRVLRKVAFGLFGLGFVAAAGIWMFEFLPFGESRDTKAKLEGSQKLIQTVDAYVLAVLWIAAALTVIGLLIAASGMKKGPGVPPAGAKREAP